MRATSTRFATSPSLRAAAGLLLVLGFSAGCAGTYEPRQGRRVSVVSDGWGAPKLHKDGRTFSVGFAGRGLEEAVRGNPRAEEAASSYSTQMTAGAVTGILGAVGVGVGTGLIVVDTTKDRNKFPAAGVGILAAGLAVAITGTILQANAQIHFWNAINIYNDDMAPAWPGAGPYPMVPRPGAPWAPAPPHTPPQTWEGPRGAPPSPPAAAPPAGSPPSTTVSPPTSLPPAPSLPPGLTPPGTAPEPLGPRR
jgi:hypothetical protein